MGRGTGKISDKNRRTPAGKKGMGGPKETIKITHELRRVCVERRFITKARRIRFRLVKRGLPNQITFMVD